eukprot:m.486555 g.486555  ORF g.486555 m.486555 type:complete len:61 (+) comp24490_c0_seq1:214-396(+)
MVGPNCWRDEAMNGDASHVSAFVLPLQEPLCNADSSIVVPKRRLLEHLTFPPCSTDSLLD